MYEIVREKTSTLLGNSEACLGKCNHFTRTRKHFEFESFLEIYFNLVCSIDLLMQLLVNNDITKKKHKTPKLLDVEKSLVKKYDIKVSG